ncbi:ATPase, T2SS/T4P/T4SS family [Noviherbaspirillum pedocola]|uniref:Flp pilus assembly complex ATPase component TadA n=1 Tax=Noviherbaspirillum pedocola TaxID=2801341 RepID=A0A934SXU2_9BURK|nr:ATPase, T2SS/T4P/T4SS family [Noviherbaspirillum pedocola]MBK4733733.1 Flp pilus assembly complex ATPase component TadA [Noviherbaspirillum pedocola]
MLEVEVLDADGARRTLRVPDDCMIGKAAQSEIRLEGWRIAREHARLFATPAGVVLEDLGAFGGVTVNGERIIGQHGPLSGADLIGIGAYRLRILEGETSHADAPAAVCAPLSPSTAAAPSHDAPAATARAQMKLPQTGTEPPQTRIEPPLRQLEFAWRQRLHARLLETMDLRRQDVHGMSDAQLRRETESLVRQILQEAEAELPRELDRDLLATQVIHEAIGLGPLEELLADEAVTEIMVNRHDEIYVERAGRLFRHPLAFTGERAVLGVIERIVAPLGRRIDESSPMVDARLKDGSRVNAIIPPLALKGPCLTIRKFARRKLDAADLIGFEAISPEMARFLEVCVVARKNIIVSGGTGSGKTTLLNILSNFIPPGERVITVEDAAELKLNHAHLVSLESRPANVEGKGAVPIRELVKNTLRMRPDRIVVGECRGAEALDMLQAMNTGHEGSLTTLHANTPRDGLARLETMVLMAGMELPLAAIREQIASAVHIVVQQTRYACGSRKVSCIAEVTGIESGKIQMQELFRFVNCGYTGPGKRVAGHFTGCEVVPSFYEELRACGTALDMGLFAANPVESTRSAGIGDVP